jgi:hypothetical protein
VGLSVSGLSRSRNVSVVYGIKLVSVFSTVINNLGALFQVARRAKRLNIINRIRATLTDWHNMVNVQFAACPTSYAHVAEAVTQGLPLCDCITAPSFQPCAPYMGLRPDLFGMSLTVLSLARPEDFSVLFLVALFARLNAVLVSLMITTTTLPLCPLYLRRSILDFAPSTHRGCGRSGELNGGWYAQM